MVPGFSRGEAPSRLHPLITSERQTGNSWFVSARHYPTDDVEVVALKLSPDDRFHGGGGVGRKNTDKETMDEHVLRKSQARAVTSVRRKALAMAADRMLTLTFRENVTDSDEAWQVFKYFSRLMRAHYSDRDEKRPRPSKSLPQDERERSTRWVYIAVQERQARGAIHFHLAVKGFFNVNILRHFWLRAAGDRGGNIDIASSKRQMGKRSWNPRRIAQYLAGYMTKVDIAAFNKRRFSTGGGIQLPEPVKGWISCGLPMPVVLRQVVESMSRFKIATYREGDAFWPFLFVSTA